MLYKKYPLYDGQMEIMIPSVLKPIGTKKKTSSKSSSTIKLGDVLFTQYTWISDDRNVVVSLSKGLSDMNEDELVARMQDYYARYKRDLPEFQCQSIFKRKIGDSFYGQMLYSSEMMSYKFYNVFVLGEFQECELILTMQCIDSEKKEYEHIFANITDSIKKIS